MKVRRESARCFGSMDDALISLTQEILERGEIAYPRGLETRELLGASFTLSNPRARRITIPSRRWSEPLAVGELAWHLAASDSVDFIAYYAEPWRSFSDDGITIPGSCYGKRMFGHARGQRSQWATVKEILQKDPESRRAVLVFQDGPTADRSETRDLACISSIQFLLRQGSLNCLTVMRSNDLIWGLGYDVFLVTMLQERMAVELAVDVGWYHHFTGSLHLYRQHYRMAEQIASEVLAGAPKPMPAMTDVEALPRFLNAEKALREGNPDAFDIAAALPTYWKALANPLIAWRKSRKLGAGEPA
jgi:thymidylate synthase